MNRASGIRDTPVGRFYATAQVRLRTLFTIFLLNFLGVFYLVRLWFWPRLEEDLLVRGAEVVALTPFDVVLLQAKLATIGGILLTLPALIVLSRGPISERGALSWVRLHWRVALGAGVLAAVLFVGGVVYAYAVIFPFLFEFLTANAIASGFTPTYSIVHWTQFTLTLMLVMGVAAELPLVMTSLVYAEIVTYETLRDHWRIAVFGVVIAASVVNGSPDPFSMLLVAAPLVALYGAGLVCANLVASARRSDQLSKTHVRDEAEFAVAGEASGGTAGATASNADPAAGGTADVDQNSSRITDAIESTAFSAASAFAESTSDDDIGGYYDDLRYVVGHLREKLLIIGSAFMLVFLGTFTALYQGGMRILVTDFTGRLPAHVRSTDVDIVLIHPVEILAFEMKVAAILALVAVVPLICYYAWPALLERGLAAGSRVVFQWWALVLGVGLLAGSVTGYLFVAPVLMGYLVTDAVHAGMVISYRAPSFFWLVFLASFGIGLLADVVLTMVLFHLAGIVSYRTMRRRWREVTLAFCCLGAILPQGILVMLVLAVPVMAAYGVGLVVLWVASLGGRIGYGQAV